MTELLSILNLNPAYRNLAHEFVQILTGSEDSKRWHKDGTMEDENGRLYVSTFIRHEGLEIAEVYASDDNLDYIALVREV